MRVSNFLTILCFFFSFTLGASCDLAIDRTSTQVERFSQISRQMGCSQKKAFYQQPRLDLSDRLSHQPDFLKSDIVLMSVEHNNFENVVYPQFIEAMARNGRQTDCFLLERSVEDIEEKQFIDAINRGEAVDWNSMKGHFDLPLLQYLSRAKIKVIAVDTEQFEDIEDDDTAWLNARDQNFANRIQEVFQTRSCKKPFFPIGGAHLASGSNGRTNLVKLLKERKVSNSRAGLIIQGIQSTFDQEDMPGLGLGWSWRKTNISINHLSEINKQDFVCPSIPKLGIEELYTLPGTGAAAPTYFDASTNKFLGSSADADFWIAYTCQTAKCRQANTSIQRRLNQLGISSY